MMIEAEVQSSVTAQMEACCQALFERWCEERRVIPLAYLMHAWPLITPSAACLRHLSRSLHDLLISHFESLGAHERVLIKDAIALAEYPARKGT